MLLPYFLRATQTDPIVREDFDQVQESKDTKYTHGYSANSSTLCQIYFLLFDFFSCFLLEGAVEDISTPVNNPRGSSIGTTASILGLNNDATLDFAADWVLDSSGATCPTRVAAGDFLLLLAALFWVIGANNPNGSATG